MLQVVSKAFFHTLAGSTALKHLASRYGMAGPNSFARRFIAGEALDGAIEAARGVEAQGMMVTLDYLGESVTSLEEVRAASRAYLDVIDQVIESGISRNISLKLSQLGVKLDRQVCVESLQTILDRGREHDFFVRIDMEDSPYTQVTLDIFEGVWQRGYRNVGVVLQSYLRRSEGDVQRMNELGARVRLVKGAYKEPKTVAYQDKADVDSAFLTLMQRLLRDGRYPAIATHDPAMIDATRLFARKHGIARNRFEFQMLYGIRRDLQASLTAEGYPFRVYVPFGHEWFPYFMRRLAERPANVMFVLTHLFR